MPADSCHRIAFASLLIAVRALGRCVENYPERIDSHQGLTSIPRDLALLWQ